MQQGVHPVGHDFAAGHAAPALLDRLLVLGRLAARDGVERPHDLVLVDRGDAQRSQQRQDVIVQVAAVLANARRLLVPAGVFDHVAFGQLGDGLDRAPVALAGMVALLDFALGDEGLIAGEVRRQHVDAVASDPEAVQPTVQPVLVDVDFLALRRDLEPEAGERIIPDEQVPIARTGRIHHRFADSRLHSTPLRRFTDSMQHAPAIFQQSPRIELGRITPYRAANRGIGR